MKTTKTYWFGTKRIGFDYGPRTWQGWLAVAISALAVMVGLHIPGIEADRSLRLTVLIALTVVFLAVFFWKLDMSRR